MAVATTTNYAPTVWVDAADGSALRNYPLAAGETIDYRGVALSADGATAYAVSHLSHAYKLHVFTSEAQTPALTLTGPATAAPGKPVTLTGTFGGGAGKQLAVTRTDVTGTHDLAAVTTGAGGAFTVTDQPTGGDNVYAVSFAGDGTWGPARANATVTVDRRNSGVWVETDRPHYAYGATAKVTIWVGHTSGTVCLASNLGQSICTETDQSGVAHLTYDLVQNTTLTASFAGNATYAPASMTIKVRTSAQVQERMTGHGRLEVVVQPYRPGAKVRFTEQALVHGAWRTVGTRTVKLDGNSRATGTPIGPIVKKRPYRMRASFIADATNAAADGAWKTFKITR
ncbi:hypothetical protein [Actinoplanes sp. NPDC026619]|uniref:hypothetical protein n=1 Tax=Actinoplanes sp. NPDC026619 TaxID=3155798 RepID=UPI0033D8E57F